MSLEREWDGGGKVTNESPEGIDRRLFGLPVGFLEFEGGLLVNNHMEMDGVFIVIRRINWFLKSFALEN